MVTEKRTHHLCQAFPLWESTRTLGQRRRGGSVPSHSPSSHICPPSPVSSHTQELEGQSSETHPRSHTKWWLELGLPPASIFKAFVLGPWSPRPLSLFSASESPLPLGWLSEVFQTSPAPMPPSRTCFPPTEGASQLPATAVKALRPHPHTGAILSCWVHPGVGAVSAIPHSLHKAKLREQPSRW